MRTSPAAPAAAPAFSKVDLEDELGCVHARAFARLLAQACWLRAHSSSTRMESSAQAPCEPADLAGWRREGLDARRLARIDGYELPGLLRRCLAHELARWPSVARLAHAALEQSAAEARRWQLGRWLVAAREEVR